MIGDEKIFVYTKYDNMDSNYCLYVNRIGGGVLLQRYT